MSTNLHLSHEGRKARGVRVRANKLMREIAIDMGVSSVDVSDFERGSRPFDQDFVDRYYAAVWKEKLTASDQEKEVEL